MKKQFFRVKQLADQTFNRTGKTNVLSDDLQDADRKAEFIKNACQTLAKKVPSLLLGSVESASLNERELKERLEKASKKSPQNLLAASLREVSQTGDADSALRRCLEECARTEANLVTNNAELDELIYLKVVSNLQKILDIEIPSVTKQKRNVEKMCLDMNSAKSRYTQAYKHGANTAAGSAKVESSKEELEESETKLEQSRDALACELFQLILRETDLCQYLLEFYKYRREYYENAFRQLDDLIPELERVFGDSGDLKVYGTRLEDHLRVTQRKLALPIELCVCALIELGMEEEGLFRLAGASSKVKRMKLSLDAGCLTLAGALSYRDPHVIAGCLKSYLRELPEPILTFSLYNEWLDAARINNEADRRRQFQVVLQKLPVTHFENLRYLTRFFHQLSRLSSSNKMTPQNLAIILAPNLIWADGSNPGINLTALNNTSLYSRIAESLVMDCEIFFPGDYEFFETFVPITNGDQEGIDNRGFDPRTPESGMKRSQSVNSLTEEPAGSPKPVLRKKNKPVAPTPPVDKTPRPLTISAAPSTPNATASLPRPAKIKPPRLEIKENDENGLMSQSVSGVEGLIKAEIEAEVKNSVKPQPEVEKKSKTTQATNTEPISLTECRQDLKVAKEKWLLGGGKPALPERPAIPERPPALKPTVKALRSAFDNRQNYENTSVSSSENLSGDERTLQRTQVYSIEKQQIAIINVNDKKRERNREKRNSIEKVANELERRPSKELPDISDQDSNVSSTENAVLEDKPREKTPVEEDKEKPLIRKLSLSESRRPTSLSSSERPERPPKPEHFTSPSHSRTLSDGQIIDARDARFGPQRSNSNEGPRPSFTIKHPSTSPPPPPVPAKPRAVSQGDSTDF